MKTKNGEIMLYTFSTLAEWAPTLMERFFKLYFSPIFRGLAAYVIHQLVGMWASM